MKTESNIYFVLAFFLRLVLGYVQWDWSEEDELVERIDWRKGENNQVKVRGMKCEQVRMREKDSTCHLGCAKEKPLKKNYFLPRDQRLVYKLKEQSFLSPSCSYTCDVKN